MCGACSNLLEEKMGGYTYGHQFSRDELKADVFVKRARSRYLPENTMAERTHIHSTLEARESP